MEDIISEKTKIRLAKLKKRKEKKILDYIKLKIKELNEKNYIYFD